MSQVTLLRGLLRPCPDDLDRGREQGFDDYLVGPGHVQETVSAVRSLCHRLESNANMPTAEIPVNVVQARSAAGAGGKAVLPFC